MKIDDGYAFWTEECKNTITRVEFVGYIPTLLITKALNNNFTGKVAIGAVTNPQAKLHLKADNNEDAGVIIEPTDKNGHKAFIKLFDDTHSIMVDHSSDMELNAGSGNLNLLAPGITLSGKVGINTVNEVKDYALAVNGGIISTKVYIKEVNQWPDFVFDNEYSLMGLKELKHYVADHRHLPGLPSEKEILHNGYDLNEMQSTMLQKIEELTRYVLLLQDEIDELRQQGDSIVFSYDSNGNRISRSLAFERVTPPSIPHAPATPSAYTLFPNPTSSGFTLQHHTPCESTIHAVLLNTTGTVLEEKETIGQDLIFDLSKYSEGVYLLEVDGPTGRESWKVIKK